MKKFLIISLLLVLTALVSIVLTVYLIDTSETPDSYNIHEIDSKVLSEKREIIVKLPSDYDESADKTYPVIYVFGGNSLTYSIANDTELLKRTGHLESVIIVGIQSMNQKIRQRDLTPPFLKQDLDETDSPLGKVDDYLSFIQNELIRFIDSKYRSSSFKIAVGHSREGLMVMYALITKPELFHGYVALSPALWRENDLFVDMFKETISGIKTLNTLLFLSMGEEEVDKMKNAFNLTVQFLNTDSISKKIIWKSMYTKGAVHSNNALLSAPIGIEWILDGKKNLQFK